MLDDLPRQVANVNGLNKNLGQREFKGFYFAAILHFSFSCVVISVKNPAARISVAENITATATSDHGTSEFTVEKNANNNGAYNQQFLLFLT